MWAWFRKWWVVINGIYFVVLLIAAKIAPGNASPLFIVLFGTLIISFGLDGISSGEVGLYVAYRSKNPVTYWVMIIMVLFLGFVFLIGGVRSLLGVSPWAWMF